MTAALTTQQRLLKKSIKDGGVAGIPTSYYRKALDLNRFSNSVANKLLESYRRQIVKAVKELERIDKMPSSKKPQFKAARMRALMKQNLDSMRTWSKLSVKELIGQLDGLADVEVSFAEAELKRAVPANIKTSVRTVEVTEAFAESVVKADPLNVGTNLLRQNIEEAVKGPGAIMKLTARQGAIIRMPNGTSIEKAFRGLAERQGELFSRAVLDGLLTGESTTSIARSLYGELGFSTKALTPRQVALAQSGNAWKLAKHQVRTLVRTSVNATANAASYKVYESNSDVTKKYRWVATLDSRTSPICRNLDQTVYEYGKGPTPASPPHFNCRSTTVPVIDYEGLGFSPPPNTQGYRPTTESKPNSKEPDGGRVPVNVSAAQHIHDLRAGTKSGRKSRFEPSDAQVRMLNGGKVSEGGKQKARYFNRLADRYGPEGAMKRFMREDGSEVSLQQLRSRYGQPDKITKSKKAAAPKPKTTQDLRDELAQAKAKTAALKAAADKAKAEADRTRRALEAETRRQQASVPSSGDPLQYVAGHQLSNGKAKIGVAEVQNSFAELAKGNTESAKNFRAMMQFQEKNDLSTIWSTGREKMPADFKYWTDSEPFRSSQVAAIARGKKTMPTGGRIKDEANIASIYNEKLLRDIDEGYFGSRITALGKLKSGEAGHTANSFGAIVVKQGSHQVGINAARAERIRAATRETVRSSADGRPKYVTYQDLMKKGTVKAPEDWLMTYVHEMGHQVHYAAGVPQFRGMLPTDLLQRAAQNNMDGIKALGEIKAKTWKPSKYGDSNEYERFAETFVQFVFAPEQLKKASPDAYNWVKAALEKGLK